MISPHSSIRWYLHNLLQELLGLGEARHHFDVLVSILDAAQDKILVLQTSFAGSIAQHENALGGTDSENAFTCGTPHMHACAGMRRT